MEYKGCAHDYYMLSYGADLMYKQKPLHADCERQYREYMAERVVRLFKRAGKLPPAWTVAARA